MQKDNEKKPEQYDDIKIVSARTVEDILRVRDNHRVFSISTKIFPHPS